MAEAARKMHSPEEIEPGPRSLTETELQMELERRYEEHLKNPGQGHTWDDVKQKVRAQFRK